MNNILNLILIIVLVPVIIWNIAIAVHVLFPNTFLKNYSIITKEPSKGKLAFLYLNFAYLLLRFVVSAYEHI